MSATFWLRLGGAVAVLLLTVWAWGLNRQVDAQQALIKAQADDVAKLTTEIAASMDLHRRAREQMSRLLAAQSEIRLLATARADQTRKLQREHPDVQPWADTPLPAAVQRLRQRPAIVGAGAYRERMSAGDAVPSESQQSGKHGGTEPVD